MRTMIAALVAAAVLIAGACTRSETEEQEWNRGWDQIARGGKDVAHAGGIALERARDGAIRAYHNVQPVAGKVGEKIEDAAIVASVKARLAADPNTHVGSVDVDSDHGRVTLKGRVSSAAEAAAAVRVAVGTRGVNEVMSRLTW